MAAAAPSGTALLSACVEKHADNAAVLLSSAAFVGKLAVTSPTGAARARAPRAARKGGALTPARSPPRRPLPPAARSFAAGRGGDRRDIRLSRRY